MSYIISFNEENNFVDNFTKWMPYTMLEELMHGKYHWSSLL